MFSELNTRISNIFSIERAIERLRAAAARSDNLIFKHLAGKEITSLEDNLNEVNSFLNSRYL